MKYKYVITIYFRNGKILTLYANQHSIFKDPGGVSLVMSIDKKIMVELPESIGNTFEVDQVTYYNAFPRPALYERFPPDWNPDKESFQLIDKINVSSHGVETGDKADRPKPKPPIDEC
jgi:hypothetical protein